SLLLTLQPLDAAAIQLLIERALDDPRGLGGGLDLPADSLAHLLRLSAGDARRALTALEAAAGAARSLGQQRIDLPLLEPADVRAGGAGAVPAALRDAHYPGAKRLQHGGGYRYPHDFPGGVVEQQYPPDEVLGRD